VADLTALPLPPASVDDAVAAFVLNHLRLPALGVAELIRVTRPGGAVLATVYSNASRSPVRDRIDQLAREAGWQVPRWYLDLKATATPLLGRAAAMAAAARASGLRDVVVDERPVDVGVTEAEQLVAYRFGQAHFAGWLDQLGPDRADHIRRQVADDIRPIMEPYQPMVVFLTAKVPTQGG
jgi:SAM-dependent methyltransferase